MKILYYVGKDVLRGTKLSKGTIDENADTLVINGNNEKIILDGLEYAGTEKMPGGGTMIKIINNGQTIFLNVPRIFIDKGSGFCVSNYFKTMKLGKIINQRINSM
ncbi:MAG: hypothetical protein IJ725_02090 [Ruminococcus sp.]|nr:hypothetical protein [Ruminococcus sp.]